MESSVRPSTHYAIILIIEKCVLDMFEYISTEQCLILGLLLSENIGMDFA